MPPKPDALLIRAIQQKRLISFVYQGADRLQCEPHLFGVANGRRQVLCYQLSGESARGALPEWRRFDLGEIRELKVLNERFPGPRESAAPNSLGWTQTIAMVS